MQEQFTDSAADYAHSPFPLIGGDTYEERGLVENRLDTPIARGIEVDAGPAEIRAHFGEIVDEALSA